MEPQKPKRNLLKVLILVSVIGLGGAVVLGSLSRTGENATADLQQPVADSQQSAAPDPAQATSSDVSATESSDASQDGGTPLVRKTMSGIVRTSVIGFNKDMGISEQTIIFGGDAGAIRDGTASYCIIDGDKNFANAVEGDTITVTGELAQGTKALINCRVDSIQ